MARRLGSNNSKQMRTVHPKNCAGSPKAKLHYINFWFLHATLPLTSYTNFSSIGLACDGRGFGQSVLNVYIMISFISTCVAVNL